MALFKIAYTRVNTVKIRVKQTLFWYISSNIVSIINAMNMLCCAKTRPEQSYVDSTENISVPFGPTEADRLELQLLSADYSHMCTVCVCLHHFHCTCCSWRRCKLETIALLKTTCTLLNRENIRIKLTPFWYILSNVVSIRNTMNILCSKNKARAELCWKYWNNLGSSHARWNKQHYCKITVIWGKL